MPRDGSGVYSKPAGTTASPNTTIESAKYNAFGDDLVTDLNAARPITAGGTGETTARLKDGTWRFQNTADTTKLMAFDLSGLTTTTTRTVTVPDADLTLPIVTPWVAYTPTFTAIGTVTGVNIASRRVGGSLEVKGRFTAGTPTASTVSMTLGFGGTNNNATVAALFTSRIIVGHGALSYIAAVSPAVLGVGGEGYVTFGFQSATQAGLNPIAGSTLAASGDTFTFAISVPIEGWN
jgi:hypothetical protein